jgi:hypothetical protein
LKRPDVTIEHTRPARRLWRTWATTEPSLVGLSWDRFRHELRHGPAGRQDELLTALVRIARADRDAVTIVAACLVPGLRARIAVHAPGLPADDAWGEAVAGLCAAIDAVDLSVGFVASRLLEVVRRHLQRAVKHEAVWRSHTREVPDRAGPERVEEPSGALMVTTAVRAGVISGRDAWLLHATFVVGHSVGFAAGRLDLGYEAAKKRRQRAGERWGSWWSPDRPATSTTTEGGGYGQLRRA